MKIFSKLFFVFATVSNAQEASVLDSHGFSEGVFDNTVLYESVDKRVRRQVDDIEGSVEPDDILSKITTTVETTLITEIAFDEDLLNKNSDAYSAKKAEIIEDFTPILEIISDDSSAEYTKEEIDVTFVRASESRRRRQADSSMNVVLKIPFVSESTEALSDELKTSVQDNIEKITTETITEELASGNIDADSLFTQDQEVSVDSVVDAEDLREWNSGSQLKICNSVFIATILLKLLN
ncbi:unnamed protein product [Oikopleura dioica]|uniref:SEA domain-containing protein n=1 Tax=Oikopleura dioica TaxID=34765 RepID=E4WXL2_OIKDI|nr:unnamed protein product [Oikopleura dioica]